MHWPGRWPGSLARFSGWHDPLVVRLHAYAVLSAIVTLVSVFGHAGMVAVQRFMIPTAGFSRCSRNRPRCMAPSATM
jgi:hypothetical protein